MKLDKTLRKLVDEHGAADVCYWLIDQGYAQPRAYELHIGNSAFKLCYGGHADVLGAKHPLFKLPLDEEKT